jgi:CBS domain-containing protein
MTATPTESFPGRPLSARPISVAEVMSDVPPTIHGEESFSLAHEIMKRRGVRYLPVLDAGERLVGLLAREDRYLTPPSTSGRVSEAMTTAYAVAPGDLATEVARAMRDRGCDCAVVVDRGQVVGLFTAEGSLVLPAEKAATEGACP